MIRLWLAVSILVLALSASPLLAQPPSIGGGLVDEVGVWRPVQRSFADATILGDTEIVAAQGAGVRIRVLGIHCQSLLAVTLKLKSAGANIISAAFAVGAAGSLSMSYNPHGWFQTNANEALNLNQSAAVNTGCQVVWVRAA
jgi:hypothetical protein